MIQKSVLRCARSWNTRSVSSRRSIITHATDLPNATAQVVPRSRIPHILVYALGNYPYPLSRHSLPQSLLPLILQQFGSPSITGSKGALSDKENQTNALKLVKKHDCWIDGRLVDFERQMQPSERRSKPYKPLDVSPESAVMTIVKPRLLMNIAGRPLPFLLRSGSELLHVKTIVEEHPNIDINPDVTLVVLHDSLEIPPMALTKPKRNVGPQGHNGLRSIEAALGTRDFWRIGLGIGRPPGGKGRGDGIRDWVLGDIQQGSDERIFWEGEGTSAICRALREIALKSKSAKST